MAKAKEYAKSFLTKDLSTDAGINKAVSDTAIAFMTEIEDICEMRHSTSFESIASATKEQCQKWIAFSRIVNKKLDMELIKDDGFKQFVLVKLPELRGRI